MTNVKLSLLLLLSIIVGQFTTMGGTHADENIIKVLYINSYHIGYQWSDDVYKGLKLSLSENHNQVDMTVEYMDTKRFPDERTRKTFIKNMRDKYSQNDFDIVIASDDAAYDYIQNEGKDIFGNIPFVFCGVNNEDVLQIEKHENFTGVVDVLEFVKTIKVAMNINENVKNVYYIEDETHSGKLVIQELLDAKDDQNYELKKVEGDNIEEIFENIYGLDNDSIVLLIGMFRKNGVFYDDSEVAKYLEKVENVAVYGNQGYYFNYGLLGGYISNGFDHGRKAGEMATEILDGKLPQDIKIVGKDFNELWFNYVAVDKHGIDIGKLPEDSKLTNYSNDGNKNIGILHSYSTNSYSSAQFEKGIRDFLDQKNYSYNIVNEYLDIEKTYDPNYLNTFYNYFSYKYEKVALDVVVSTKDPAYEFLEKYNMLTENRPYVYSYTSDELDIRKDLVNSTGIIGRQNITENIELAKMINPKLKNIIFITDKTDIGRGHKESILSFYGQYGDQLEFIFWDNYRIDQISTKASLLKDDSMIIFMNFSKDVQNKTFLQDESFKIIAKSSSVPVLTTNDEFITKGALGGAVVSSYKTGLLVGSRLDMLFKGSNLDAIPLELIDNTESVFEYNLLKKFKIDKALLPEGSIIINEPKSVKAFLSENKIVANSLLAVVFSVLSIIIVLAYYIQYKDRVQTKINHFATNDGLTNTYNRRHAYVLIKDLMEEVNERKSLFSVCFIDIDGLKTVNDNIGHTEGDRLIVDVCDVIKRNIRGNDFLARFGGDEFLIVMPGATERTAKKVINRVLDDVNNINELGENKYKISFSKGFAEYSFDNQISIEKLIHTADKNMYSEKEQIRRSIEYETVQMIKNNASF